MMNVKSERVTILATPEFKEFLIAEARAYGVSVSELIRERCSASLDTDEDESMLASMVRRVNKSAAAAEKALDKGLADVATILERNRDGRVSQKEL